MDSERPDVQVIRRKTVRNSRSHFQRGSGRYDCTECGRGTRNTGEQAVGSTLCPECWDLAGLENTLSDYGEVKPSEVSALLDSCVKRGGDRARLERSFGSLIEWCRERDTLFWALNPESEVPPAKENSPAPTVVRRGPGRPRTRPIEPPQPPKQRADHAETDVIEVLEVPHAREGSLRAARYSQLETGQTVKDYLDRASEAAPTRPRFKRHADLIRLEREGYIATHRPDEWARQQEAA